MIVISAALIPLDGIPAKFTGTTTCSPTLPLTELTLTANPTDVASAFPVDITVHKSNAHNTTERHFLIFDTNIYFPPKKIFI